MGLATMINNMSYKKDIFNFLRDNSANRFTDSELNEALDMVGANYRQFNTKEQKLQALIDHFR